MDSVLDRTRAVVANKLCMPLDVVGEGSRLVADLGADSLDLAELVLALEDELGVRLGIEALPGIVTVGDAARHVEALLAARASGTDATRPAGADAARAPDGDAPRG